MRLREAAGIAGWNVVRDGEFSDLALASHADVRSLVYAAAAGLIEGLATHRPAAVVTTPAAASRVPDGIALATSDDPERAFYELHAALMKTGFYWTDAPSRIDGSARIDPAAHVAARNVVIGAGCVIEPNVTILERVVLGSGVIVRAGAVLGAEGFEFKGPAMRQGRLSRADTVYGGVTAIPHAGSVWIGDRVEIQANSTVDRSVFREPTRIGADTKVDNLVHVAHNVQIGERTFITAGVTIAGSAHIGNEVWLGPGAVISSGVTIGDGAAVVIGTTVTRDVAPGARVANNLRLYKLP
ncbi:MAG TPA: UDP-3-O-(3-hydroxymyristoyl)glucosamine N-acyltransferase [Candidatus Limnocylindria bacterium]